MEENASRAMNGLGRLSRLDRLPYGYSYCYKDLQHLDELAVVSSAYLGTIVSNAKQGPNTT